MPFIGSVSGSRGGRIFSLGGKPAAVGAVSLAAGDATDTFSWSAPQNNGVPITKYAYQVSSDNGSTWYSSIGGTLNGETETSNLSVALSTQYSLSSYKIRVRAFNAVGWGEYSSASSSATVAWTSNTGTASESQTDTGCSTGTCSEECSCGSCNCGTNSGTRTRTSSRSRSRSRSTQYYSRDGSTNSPTSYGSWSISQYEWDLGASSSVGWGSLTYGDWSACGTCSGCTAESFIHTYGTYTNSSGQTQTYYPTYDAYGSPYMVKSNDDSCGSCYFNAFSIYYCSVSNSYRIVGEGCKYIGGPKC